MRLIMTLSKQQEMPQLQAITIQLNTHWITDRQSICTQ